MKRDNRLLFGPLAALVLAAGIAVLGRTVPGYSQVHQTVSEIGEVASPARLPFTVMLCAVALCLVVFAAGVRHASIQERRNTIAAWLIGFMAVPAAGTGLFPFPHPWHNLFGMSELIGYQAPLAMALAWRGDPKAKGLVRFSWIMFAVVWLAILLNMSSIARASAPQVWAHIRPVYGLVQRALFAAWFGWAAVAGLMLWRRRDETAA